MCCGEESTKPNLRSKEWTLYNRLSEPLDSGCKYEGEWAKGMPNGVGKAYWPDGWQFEGAFVDGKPHGG